MTYKDLHVYISGHIRAYKDIYGHIRAYKDIHGQKDIPADYTTDYYYRLLLETITTDYYYRLYYRLLHTRTEGHTRWPWRAEKVGRAPTPAQLLRIYI